MHLLSPLIIPQKRHESPSNQICQGTGFCCINTRYCQKAPVLSLWPVCNLTSWSHLINPGCVIHRLISNNALSFLIRKDVESEYDPPSFQVFLGNKTACMQTSKRLNKLCGSCFKTSPFVYYIDGSCTFQVYPGVLIRWFQEELCSAQWKSIYNAHVTQEQIMNIT